MKHDSVNNITVIQQLFPLTVHVKLVWLGIEIVYDETLCGWVDQWSQKHVVGQKTDEWLLGATLWWQENNAKKNSSHHLDLIKENETRRFKSPSTEVVI